jgi:hypothetical protein
LYFSPTGGRNPLKFKSIFAPFPLKEVVLYRKAPLPLRGISPKRELNSGVKKNYSSVQKLAPLQEGVGGSK